MAKTERITARVEPAIKEKADALFKRCGLTTSDAINMFLHQSLLANGLPFSVDGTAKATRDLSR